MSIETVGEIRGVKFFYRNSGILIRSVDLFFCLWIRLAISSLSLSQSPLSLSRYFTIHYHHWLSRLTIFFTCGVAKAIYNYHVFPTWAGAAGSNNNKRWDRKKIPRVLYIQEIRWGDIWMRNIAIKIEGYVWKIVFKYCGNDRGKE